jgi:hypothetical protein
MWTIPLNNRNNQQWPRTPYFIVSIKYIIITNIIILMYLLFIIKQ